VVKKDLKPGDQLAQSCHACFQFASEHPHLTNEWIRDSNYICILEIDNEQELVTLYERALREDIPNSRFIEPDFDNALTALALGPGPQTKKLCSKLKLALKSD
jgi:peptidyl-tRNA hydrolase